MNNNVLSNLNISNEIINEIGKFSLLWNLFERNYCNNNCTCQKIRELSILENETLINNCYSLTTTLLDYLGATQEQISEEYIRFRMYDSNYNNEYQEELSNVLQNKHANNKELIIGCLFIIRRIRNNLFHGLKNCKNINNQLEVFKSSNELLNTIMFNSTF